MELSIRIVYRMLVILVSNLGKVPSSGTVLVHVFFACISEELGSTRSVLQVRGLGVVTHGKSSHSSHCLKVFVHRICAIIPNTLQRTGLHLLKTTGQGTLNGTVLYSLASDYSEKD